MGKIFKLKIATKIALSFAVIILLFVAVFAHIFFSYRNVDNLLTVRTEYVWTRTTYLFEFNTIFLDLRLTLSDTYFSDYWIENAQENDWVRLDYMLRQEHYNFMYRTQRYMYLVRTDRFLTSGQRMSRLVSMQAIRDNVNALFGLVIDEDFISTLRNRQESYENIQNETYRQIEELSASVGSSMATLHEMAEEAEAQIDRLIDDAIATSVSVVIFVVVLAFALSVLLARMVVKSVQDMAIEKTIEADDHNRALLQTIPFSLTMWRTLGAGGYEIYDCNAKAVEFFEYDGTKEELLRDYLKYIPERQPDGTMTSVLIDEIMENSATHGSGKMEFYHHKASDGRLFPSDINYVKTYFMGQEIVFIYAEETTDVKESQQREQEEIARRKSIEEESKAKTKFLARMSHEIRTPLNAVLGITEIEMLKEDHSTETEDAFLRIYNSSSLLLAIINDILDLSKVESGKMEIVSTDYEMASLIVDTVQLNLMHVGSKQLTFKLKVDETIPSHLIGDELRIKQVLNNILSNAFKYTNEGHVHLTVSKEQTETGVNLVFRVEDTGTGMTKEQVNSLFNLEYTRFNIASNRAIEGTGLGMNIAYQLVTMMNGEIEVDSQIDRGTIITVTLPQDAYDVKPIGRNLAENLESMEVTQRGMRRINRFDRVPMPYGKVLVVDDVESNLFVAKGLLLPYKLSVKTVTSGLASINLLRTGEIYDIIFMDHMMPEMDGIEAVKIIRQLGYDRPIVALTANTVVGQAEMFMENGFDGFISKPIDINLLNNYLMRFIRDRHPDEAQAISPEDYVDDTDGASEKELHIEELSDEDKGVFVRDILKALENITPISAHKPLDEDAISNYLISVHSLKSVLSIVGEPELSELSAELEKAARFILNETPNYQEQLDMVLSKLSTEKIEDSKINTDEEKEYLKEQLVGLKEACDSFELLEAESILKDLIEKDWHDTIKSVLSEISYHLLMGDYDDVLEKADALIETL